LLIFIKRFIGPVTKTSPPFDPEFPVMVVLIILAIRAGILLDILIPAP